MCLGHMAAHSVVLDAPKTLGDRSRISKPAYLILLGPRGEKLNPSPSRYCDALGFPVADPAIALRTSGREDARVRRTHIKAHPVLDERYLDGRCGMLRKHKRVSSPFESDCPRIEQIATGCESIELEASVCRGAHLTVGGACGGQT